jgi:hypothetical protein
MSEKNETPLPPFPLLEMETMEIKGRETKETKRSHESHESHDSQNTKDTKEKQVLIEEIGKAKLYLSQLLRQEHQHLAIQQVLEYSQCQSDKIREWVSKVFVKEGWDLFLDSAVDSLDENVLHYYVSIRVGTFYHRLSISSEECEGEEETSEIDTPGVSGENNRDWEEKTFQDYITDVDKVQVMSWITAFKLSSSQWEAIPNQYLHLVVFARMLFHIKFAMTQGQAFTKPLACYCSTHYMENKWKLPCLSSTQELDTTKRSWMDSKKSWLTNPLWSIRR